MTVNIKPTIREVVAKITAIIDNPESRKRVLTRASEELKKIMAIYPPPGIWNRPPGTRGDNRWYERGYGSRYMRANGSVGGKKTSQQLDKSWVSKADTDSANVYTEVTYAPFLLDPDQRVNWANAHGWVSVDKTVEQFENRFTEIVLDEIDKQIEKL